MLLSATVHLSGEGWVGEGESGGERGEGCDYSHVKT